VLGGKWEDNAGSYGLAIGAVPSKNIPDVVTRIADWFVKARRHDESFQAFTQRIGKRALKEMFDDLVKVPAHDVAPAYYSDWGDPREFTIGNMGVGECAGEVVSLADFDLAAAEAQAFDAQLQLEEAHDDRADALAYRAMLTAARGLIKTAFIDIGDDPSQIVNEFRTRFYDTQLFFDKYAGGKFAQYLFRRHDAGPHAATREAARQIVEEAQLFLEASHACRARLAARPAPVVPTPSAPRPGEAEAHR
jgi:sulfite reductase (ferredoxin)